MASAVTWAIRLYTVVIGRGTSGMGKGSCMPVTKVMETSFRSLGKRLMGIFWGRSGEQERSSLCWVGALCLGI